MLELSTSAVETLLFRARRALREQLEGTLTCGEAERVLSLELDGASRRTSGPSFAPISASALSAPRSRVDSAHGARHCAASARSRYLRRSRRGAEARRSGAVSRQGRRAGRRRSRSGRHDPPGRRGRHRVAEAERSQLVAVASVSKPIDAHDSDTRTVRPAKAEVRPTRATKQRTAHVPPPTVARTTRHGRAGFHGRQSRRSQAGEAAARTVARAAHGRGRGRRAACPRFRWSSRRFRWSSRSRSCRSCRSRCPSRAQVSARSGTQEV